ncbi:TadE/TadG family type IV pilus assembly protein [Kordiimonas sp. SCSIO 12610]|uniref:TadE/TadG family type IV pilus assembly protein n=1 Tax=Kordiimonas sp. SCSIO 12610 TaxID=2829597 RepID=UPI00210E3709|nr:TadE/TadG family type IV pilus assembly protein [Kordiimonas sp. SCSIO 12610]UTW56011.1 pilus assembly protein [Kordiimonas sp. SCSIO 12610]
MIKTIPNMLFKIRKRRLLKNEEGVVVTELALILPLLVVILAGIVEVSNYILLNMKAQHTVVALGDLTTRSSTISADTVADVYTAVEEIMAPYPVELNAKVILTALSVDGASSVTDPIIIWQCTSPSLGVTEPSELGGHLDTVDFNDETITMREGETLVITEFFYDYEPIVFTNVIAPGLLRKKAFFRPRIGALQVVDPATTPEGAAAGCLSN